VDDHAEEIRRRRPVDHVRVARDRIRSHPVLRPVYRIVVGLLGVAITIGGLVLVPLPGPGWLIVLAGLAVLASEFAPARRLLDFARDTLARWTRWLGAQGLAVRAAVGVGVGLTVAACLYAAAVVLGVPGWVPDAVVTRVPGLES
jgi:uncharacterized protein (TIGR02611 family)